MDRIIIDNVKLMFGQRTLFETGCINIATESIYPLLGLNGTGKSTFLKLISGLLKTTVGNITVNGTVLYQPQKPVIFHTSVLNNAIIGMKIPDRIKAHNILVEVGLKDFINVQAKNLSGGEQQRLCIARSILTGGDILLLDEPFSAVDIKSAQLLELMLQNYCIRENKTMIVATHSIKTAEGISNQCILIRNDRLEICKISEAKEYLINTL
jgi:ABC-type nitrate/sulfonate/bicarbonate transport system ATPase subunit